MTYLTRILKKEDHLRTNWSGGTTSQLAIYPKSAKVEDQNFQWRVSTAKIEMDESKFTTFPEFQRELMVIRGSLTLISQEYQFQVNLDAFEKTSFKGDWETTSIGKTENFNLLMKRECSGLLNAYKLGKEPVEEWIGWEIANKLKNVELFYGKGKDIAVEINGVIHQLNDDEAILLERSQVADLIVRMSSSGECTMIRASIYF